MIKYEDVKNQTTEDYFKNNHFSIDAFKKKYALNENETYVDALKRVCDSIASVEETDELKKYWSERWFDEIYNDWWHPAGSIMQGAGSGKKVSLVNCTTVSLGNTKKNESWDSLEGIIQNTTYKVAKYAAFRQGLGVDFSALRPKGTSILNSANESAGAVHWMKFIDSVGNYVGQKGRIPAFLFSLSIKHPDVEEFITVKSDKTKIQNANISVQATNEFYHQVKNDGEWELSFEIPEVKIGDKVYIDADSANKDTQIILKDDCKVYYYVAKHNKKKEVFKKIVKAKYLAELIAKNMCEHAEPGIQNIDIARKYSNSDYVYDEFDEYDSRICGTNACSEQYLSPDSCCVLASINAGKFCIELEEYEKEFCKISYSMNRFLDNVNEYEIRNHTYATPNQRLAIEKLRRIGAGYTNIGAWLFKNNLEYGSPEANKALAKFTERFNYYLYKSSIELGKEKGNFGLFNREKFEQSPFVQRMMGLGLKFTHMRNVTCSSIAPTGSLSLMFRDCVMSYGIEPSFGIYYWKRTRISGKYEYYFCVPNIVREMFASKGYPIPMDSDTIKDTWDGKYGKKIAQFIDENKEKIDIKFKNATEISAFDKLELMSQVMKWIDSSISVTYMLPENANWKNVYDFIMLAHEKEVKSIAVFPDKKMYGIVSFIPFADLAKKLLLEGIQIHQQNFTEDELKTLNLPVITDKIIRKDSIKRPKELPCDIFTTNHKGKEYFVIIGKLNEEPYEIFAGENCCISKKEKNGIVVKNKRGHYSLICEDNVIIENITEYLTDNEEAITRLVSTSLRHGASIEFIVHQLEKVKGNLFSFAKILSRILKKYVEDGTKVSGANCVSCGSNNLVRSEGCSVCNDCQYSKCS